MGFVPLPPPLSRKQLADRIDQFYRDYGRYPNIYEVDPALAFWARRANAKSIRKEVNSMMNWCDLCRGAGTMTRPGRWWTWPFRVTFYRQRCTHCDGSGIEPPPWRPMGKMPQVSPPPPPKK